MALPIHDFNPTRRRAAITLAIIAVNLFVYAALQPHDGGQHEAAFTYEHAAIPCELEHDHPLSVQQNITGDCSATGGDQREFFPHKNVWLAVIVSMFLHASWLHVLGNMWFLWIFGNNVEDYLGRIGYLLFYTAAGVMAAATYTLLNFSSLTPVIGASGAIAGVMGMYLVLWPRARVLSFVFGVPLPLPAFVVLASWFGLQFLTDPQSGVAWMAHVGGFVGGALVGLALRNLKPPTPETAAA